MANRRQLYASYIEERTDQLQLKTRELKDLAIQIDQETNFQIEELRKHQQLMDLTNRLVSQTHRRVRSFSSSGNCNIYFYLMSFSLCIFLMIYFLIK